MFNYTFNATLMEHVPAITTADERPVLFS